MKVICDCGKEMYLNLWEPDQDEIYLELYCDKCGATFSGKLKPCKQKKVSLSRSKYQIIRETSKYNKYIKRFLKEVYERGKTMQYYIKTDRTSVDEIIKDLKENGFDDNNK